MNKNQTIAGIDSAKPRRLGRGLSALLGDPVAVNLPAPSNAPPNTSSAAGTGNASVRPAGAPAPVAPSASTTQHASAGDALSAEPGTRIVQIPVQMADPNRFQPRRVFDETQLNELAASIRSAGVVQPILVRPGAGGKYEIVAGERRWRACRIAGLTHVPAILAALSDEQAAEWALVENIQRTELTAMERAWAVRALGERFGLSHAQIGDKLGIDRSTAANLARLTDLEKEIHELLDAGQLSGGHAKVLVGMAPGPVRVGLAKQAAGQGWSVRRLEQAAARALAAASGAGGASSPGAQVYASKLAVAKAAAVKELEKQLSEHLGSSVRLRTGEGGKRGSIVIKFYDLDHFDGIMTKLGFAMR